MTRIINGVAYATDYEAIVGVEPGSGQHPVVRKVVTPGDVHFSAERIENDSNTEQQASAQQQPAQPQQHRRRTDTGSVPVQQKSQQPDDEVSL